MPGTACTAANTSLPTEPAGGDRERALRTHPRHASIPRLVRPGGAPNDLCGAIVKSLRGVCCLPPLLFWGLGAFSI